MVKSIGQPFCGRFKNDQLNRQIYNREEINPGAGLSRVAAGLALLTSLQLKAQQDGDQDSLFNTIENIDSLDVGIQNTANDSLTTDSLLSEETTAKPPDSLFYVEVTQPPWTLYPWQVETTSGCITIMGDAWIGPEVARAAFPLAEIGKSEEQVTESPKDENVSVLLPDADPSSDKPISEESPDEDPKYFNSKYFIHEEEEWRKKRTN